MYYKYQGECWKSRKETLGLLVMSHLLLPQSWNYVGREMFLQSLCLLLSRLLFLLCHPSNLYAATRVYLKYLQYFYTVVGSMWSEPAQYGHLGPNELNSGSVHRALGKRFTLVVSTCRLAAAHAALFLIYFPYSGSLDVWHVCHWLDFFHRKHWYMSGNAGKKIIIFVGDSPTLQISQLVQQQ